MVDLSVGSYIPTGEHCSPVGFLAEAPGDHEVAAAVAARASGRPVPGPLVGKSGWRHDKILKELGARLGVSGHSLTRSAMYHGNVFTDQLPHFAGKNNNLKAWLVDKRTNEKQMSDWYEKNYVLVGPYGSLVTPSYSVLPALERVLRTSVEGGYLDATYWHHLVRLYDELSRVGPEYLVLYGGTALWALTARNKIATSRGHIMETFALGANGKLIQAVCTYHPANTFRQETNLFKVVIDVEKVFKAAGFGQDGPKAHPARREPIIWIPETVEELKELMQRYVKGRPYCAWDIETTGRESNKAEVKRDENGDRVYPQVSDRHWFFITVIQCCADGENAIVVPFVSDTSPNGLYWQDAHEHVEVVKELKRWLERTEGPSAPLCVWQSGANYDLDVLLEELDIRACCDDDTLVMEAAWCPGSSGSKGLSELAAKYIDTGVWKGGRSGAKRDE